jgi:hypothetical protein
MTTAAEYRQFATECVVAARSAASPEVRAALLAMARRWCDLADNADRNRHLRETE